MSIRCVAHVRDIKHVLRVFRLVEGVAHLSVTKALSGVRIRLPATAAVVFLNLAPGTLLCKELVVALIVILNAGVIGARV